MLLHTTYTQYEIDESLSCEQQVGLLKNIAQDAFRPMPGLISCMYQTLSIHEMGSFPRLNYYLLKSVMDSDIQNQSCDGKKAV